MLTQYLDSFNDLSATDTSTSVSVTTTSATFQFQVALVVSSAVTNSSTPNVITPPSGWTNLTAYGGGTGSNTISAVLSYNAPNTVPDGQTYTWTFGTAGKSIVVLSRYNDVTVFNTSGGARTAQTALYSAQVTPGNGTRLVICAFAQKGNTSSLPVLSNTRLMQTTTAGGQSTATFAANLTSRVDANPRRSQNVTYSGTTFTTMVAYLSDVILTTSSAAGFYNGEATSTVSQEGAGLIATAGLQSTISRVPSIF